MEIMPFIRACKQKLLRQRLHSVENEMSIKKTTLQDGRADFREICCA